MELDYDIYSYLARGIGNGTLVPLIAHEKVSYEILDVDSINLNKNNNDSFIRYKLQVIDKYGKRKYNEDGKLMILYEDIESLNREYIKVIDRKNTFKKKISEFILVQVPESVKVPLNINTNKFITLEKDKWIDITNIQKLKFYSDKKVKLLFDVVDTNVKTLKRM